MADLNGEGEKKKKKKEKNRVNHVGPITIVGSAMFETFFVAKIFEEGF